MSNKSTNNKLEFGRIVYYEPNEIFGCNNQPVAQEDLTKYINLSVKIPSRYWNNSKFSEKKYDTILRGTSFDSDYKTFYLTDNYVNVSYNEFSADGSISAGELFGIDSIDISFDVQFFPQVTINFTDVKGFGLMSTMEYNYEAGKINDMTAKSFFTSLFNFPYPIFTLEVKGYYGKSVSFDLSLLDFHTAFDSQTGNFKTTVKFIGHMYGVYADIPMSYLMVSPYIDYKENLSNVSENSEPVGDTWKRIKDSNGNPIPTYLSVLRTYNDFLGEIEEDTNNFSIISQYVNNEYYNGVLIDIKKDLETIIECCKKSVENINDNNIITDKNIIQYVYTGKTDENNESNFEQYSKLKEKINNDSSLKNFLPGIKKQTLPPTTEGGFYIHLLIFEDINDKLKKCGLEIENYKNKKPVLKSSANADLLVKINNTIGLKPTIKNVYKMIFKHLDCFSKHFYSALVKIKPERKITFNGNYETDIPSNLKAIPPFPAVYEIGEKNNKTIIYPGELKAFKDQPEIQLTERFFDSINYFGEKSVEALYVIDKAREETYNTIITTNGLFFADAKQDEEKKIERHYNIINPQSKFVKNYTYRKEGAKDENNNYSRSETIRDIFLSRLATFWRIHHNEDWEGEKTHIAKIEASLLYDTNPILNEEVIKGLIGDDLTETTWGRYCNLSGGTYENKLWGYINYQPGDEKNAKSNIVQLAKDGRIHYNGYSGSTILVYCTNKSYTEAEEIYKNIEYDEKYKINIGNGFETPKNDVTGLTGTTIWYSPGNIIYIFENNKNNKTYNKTYYKFETVRKNDYNYGSYKKSVIGVEKSGFNFLFNKYKLYYCKNDNYGGCEIKSGPYNNGKHVYSTENNVKTTICERNKIALFNNVAISSIKEYNETYLEKEEKIYSQAIPISVIEEGDVNTNGFENKFITALDFEEQLLNLPVTFDATSDTNNYSVIGKNFQYDNGSLTEEKVVEIWKEFIKEVKDKYGVKESSTSKTLEKEVDKEKENKKIKTDIYYTLKTLYDKWFSGLNVNYFNLANDDCEFNKVHYLTTTFNDISNSMVVDIDSFINLISNSVINSETSSQSVLSFMASTAQDNNSTFLTLPMNFNRGNDKNDIDTIFKTYNFYDGSLEHDTQGVSYIVMYNGDVSHHLANNKSDYVNDGFDIANYNGNNIEENPEAKNLFISNNHDYTVPAFGVTYGMQNQNYFKNISVDTTNPSVTDYSIANTLLISQHGSDAGAYNSVPSVKSLYPIYSNRSYTCSVEMMGCMNITPLMYFQLNNVPMFRGAYLITNVHHRITPNDFSTSFSGVRVSKYKIPINTDVINLTSLLRYKKAKDAMKQYTPVSDENGGNHNVYSNDADLQLVLNREVFKTDGTVGRLYINGKFACFTMEPPYIDITKCNTPGSGSLICPNTYKITYGGSFYDEAWGTTNKHKIYKAAGTYSAKTENGKELYYTCTPRLNSNINSFNDRGILMHMGNSNLNGWSKGCIILGYPPNQDSSKDLTNSGNTILTGLTSFGIGGYKDHVDDPEKWSTFRAYKYVANIIKDAIGKSKSVKLTVNQCEIADPVTTRTVCLMDPPTYTSSKNNASLGACQKKYEKLTAVTGWDTFMKNKGMKIINNELVKVDLKYSTEDNFADVNMYGTLTNAYVSASMWETIKLITSKLNYHNENDKIVGETNNTKLIIYDAARPVLAQDFMRCLKDNNIGRKKYPAIGKPDTGNTRKGGFHQYGSAIDISILGPDDKPLFMGAYFDEPLDTGYVAGHMKLDAIITSITKNTSYEAFNFKYEKIGNGRYLTRNGKKEGKDHEYKYNYSAYYVKEINSNNNIINTFIKNYVTDVNATKIKGKCKLITDNNELKGILRNRALLILLARTAGLNIEDTEWWHYQETSPTGKTLL